MQNLDSKITCPAVVINLQDYYLVHKYEYEKINSFLKNTNNFKEFLDIGKEKSECGSFTLQMEEEKKYREDILRLAVEVLEEENKVLKKQLTENGISYDGVLLENLLKGRGFNVV